MKHCLLSIVCCAASLALSGQDLSHRDIGLLSKLETSLIDWFDQLSGSVDKLADSEDQKKLKDALKKLQASIYEVENNGRDLIMVLRTKPLDEAKANKAVQTTRTALVELQKQLKATGLSLRNQYRAGGADAEQMISNAIGQRSIWLSDLEAEIASHHISDKTIAEGSQILALQRTAGMALGEVIEKLPK